MNRRADATYVPYWYHRNFQKEFLLSQPPRWTSRFFRESDSFDENKERMLWQRLNRQGDSCLLQTKHVYNGSFLPVHLTFVMREQNLLTWESSWVKMASKANIFGAATPTLLSSGAVGVPQTAGSYRVTCFFRLSTLKKDWLPDGIADGTPVTFNITLTWHEKKRN